MKKRNEREGSGGFDSLVFHFLSKGVPRETTATGEGGFPFR